jgi:hypothetical protein
MDCAALHESCEVERLRVAADAAGPSPVLASGGWVYERVAGTFCDTTITKFNDSTSMPAVQKLSEMLKC